MQRDIPSRTTLSRAVLRKKVIGFTCGAFDVFHAGHVAMLREAKNHCDWLIVGVQTDPSIDRPEKNKPVQSIMERQIQVAACRYVDETIVYNTEEDLLFLLNILPINVRFVDETYDSKRFTGDTLKHISIFYNRRQHELSSSRLRDLVVKNTAKNV